MSVTNQLSRCVHACPENARTIKNARVDSGKIYDVLKDFRKLYNVPEDNGRF